MIWMDWKFPFYILIINYYYYLGNKHCFLECVSTNITKSLICSHSKLLDRRPWKQLL